ncbi:MAG: hypothetical protein R2932_12665 [Caldilineaceae bacterium]
MNCTPTSSTVSPICWPNRWRRGLSSSRRFAAFVETFHNKIRKKIRTTQGTENLLDLQLELETAYWLLQERILHIDYEPVPLRQGRAPDFAVRYTTSLTFMVEVTRLRTEPGDALPTEPGSPNERLIDSICRKLRQLRPQQSNVVVVGMENPLPTDDALPATLSTIQQRAEQADADFLRRHHLRNRADFFRHYVQLSEIILRGQTTAETTSALFWVNPQAKHPLPSKVRTALHRAAASSTSEP